MSILLIAVTYLVLLGLIVMLASMLSAGSKRISENIETGDALLGPEDIEKHAMELARTHNAGRRDILSVNLIKRLKSNFKLISEAHKKLTEDVEASFSVAPAAEWLLDNFYIIEEQVNEIVQSLHRAHYSRLPVLKNSRMKGFPRIYAIAVEMVSHNDGMIDEKTITRFVSAYQTRTTLTLGELWSLPLMLRIALLGNIRSISRMLLETRLQWYRAEEVVEQLVAYLDDSGSDVLKAADSCFRNGELGNPAYVEHLVQKLRRCGKKAAVLIHYMDTRLAELGTSLETVTGFQHQAMAEHQVTMGNLITSLKLVSAIDWADMFEALSTVEGILKRDPSGVYNSMDFESREYYRHIIERLAEERNLSETLVAGKAVECAREKTADAQELPPVSHVGYYLTGRGLKELESRLRANRRTFFGLARFFKSRPTAMYLGTIGVLTAAAAFLFTCYSLGAARPQERLAAAVLTLLAVLVPSSDIAVAVTNFVLCRLSLPSVLPKLELKDGIPEELSTMVIVPTLLTNVNRVSELLSQLEVYYLANRENNLYFALVGDFKDSDAKEAPGDGEITACGLEGIRLLNEKYSAGSRDIFYYFHRERSFNSAQSKWMGWERKRGAIIEFNDLLRDSRQTGFFVASGSVSKLPGIRYVITLDADTLLPMGAAKKLIGTIAHPMNRAVPDLERGIVKDGYGLLQPRIGVSVVSSNSSLFSRVFAGQGGIDPYTTAVSDVYQDFFGEGIFTGKGIYDVEVFQGILKDAIPENSVLSHDLLEGCYIRAGLVTDIELVDGYPSRYSSYAMRQHRWVRGDWQLLPWLFPTVRNSRGERAVNPLNLISRWKIFDNMRRSLLYPSLLLLIMLSFSILPGSALLWLGLVLLTIGIHFVQDLIRFSLSAPVQGTGRVKAGALRLSWFTAGILRILLQFAFLPHQAYLMSDAIVRTLIRMLFTRRNMLQWVTAADVERLLKNSRGGSWGRMWFSPFSAALLLLLAVSFCADWFFSLPAAFLWLCGPELAFRTGKRLESKVKKPDSTDLRLLRRIARKTWKYFEDMVTARDNHLPPDNFQEDPLNGIAHRTSPSNIGLSLLAILSARDLGYICLADMLERLDNMLSTVGRLDKWQGHLYNWYDTVRLKVLRPAYVSTVDSGNFIGCLIVLKAALETAAANRVVDLAHALGIRDTLELYNEEASKNGTLVDTSGIDAYLSSGKADPAEWRKILDSLWSQAAGDEIKIRRLKKMTWGSALLGALQKMRGEIESLYPFTGEFDFDAPLPPGVEPLYKQCLKSMSLVELEMSYEAVARGARAALDEKKTEAVSEAEEAGEYLSHIEKKAENALRHIRHIRNKAEEMVKAISAIIGHTSFRPLYDPKRQLLSIGYNVDEGALSKSYYDLLASEARQASYIAVARGEIDRKHWFRLGRRMTAVDDQKGLVSWTGTMFEYFMPLLLMKNYDNTLLDETYRFVISVQKKYGKTREIPWGTSESAFFAFDRSLNYQYKAFGVPELGLKRGLGSEMVVAPYATILAVTLDPIGAAQNLRRLIEEGMEGKYGFYEAADYTPSRMTRDKGMGIVKNYMVHHLGMSLVALNNYFNSDIIQARFHSDPVIRCAELLLQEKTPSGTVIAAPRRGRYVPVRFRQQEDRRVVRKYGLPDTELPRLHVLSNGSYSVVLTDGGSGLSRRNDIALTRWKEDPRDRSNGFYIFVQNINSNNAWSVTFDPFCSAPASYAAVFRPDRAEYTRRDGNIETRTQVVVSTEDNAEIRRVSLTNRSQHQRVLELTSYMEAVLLRQEDDRAHPAFSKLFVTTEFVPEYECLLAYRRPRSKGQKPGWMFHTVLTEGEIVGDIQYETDRLKFIGRNGSLRNPRALEADQPLSNSVGSVLDPILSLRRRVRLYPGQTIHLSFVLGQAESREYALELAEKYRDAKVYERAFELARTRSLIEARYLDLKPGEVELFLEMLPLVVYPGLLRKRPGGAGASPTKGQPGLWPYGISGDLPIALLVVSDREDTETLVTMLKAHEFWKMKGLDIDLAIIVEDENGYSAPLYDMVKDAVSAGFSGEAFGKSGGIFIINSNQMPEEDRRLIEVAARILIRASEGPIKEQLAVEAARPDTAAGAYESFDEKRAEAENATICQCFDYGSLLFYNGTGGFSPDGSEYVIYLKKGMHTPMPWSNVVTNGKLGFLVTESGSGYVWSENSRENKLTPWSNDPVTDPPGEALYVRDEESGIYWSITPLPVREDEDYLVRHGFGYTGFYHESHELKQELVMFAALQEPVKLSLVSLKNCSDRRRRLTLTYYARPVLGVCENRTAQYLVTGEDKKVGAVTVTNVFNPDFPGRIMFAGTSEEDFQCTGNRTEFMGIAGGLENPAAMKNEKLSGAVGPGYDPCAALRVAVEIPPGEGRELVFMLGHCREPERVAALLKTYGSAEAAKLELERVKREWSDRLGAIRVSTPDKSADLLLNGWLLYQVISCRLWSRTGFYQAGGAYGFRDQLQDVMALAANRPQLVKNQILLHASRQFGEGDVQHWWHPEDGKGIRSKYSDDLLWLPYVTCDYIRNTGDAGILDETVPYLEAEGLGEEEHERYIVPGISDTSESLYSHCTRAIDLSLRFGGHGIPLMGSGDWNDGMNAVGGGGKGESIWLGWFLISVLEAFIPLCTEKNDIERAERYKKASGEIKQAIEENGWDGSWYRRAYFDDGTPLGSVHNSECRIDSIAQSWSAISGAGRSGRVEEAMTAVENYLVDDEENIIKLLTPPFGDGELQPGYIKGYVPGVRENGGQYTHAAVWVVLAFARMGRGSKAFRLYHMLNPINHSRTPLEASRYKVEPYVMAADVYAVHPNIGRGGWTWYTGAAGWMYRVATEYMLGLRKLGDRLAIDPCVPSDWSGYSLSYRFGDSIYEICVNNPDGVERGVEAVLLDGRPAEGNEIPLVDDGGRHKVEVKMGKLS